MNNKIEITLTSIQNSYQSGIQCRIPLMKHVYTCMTTYPLIEICTPTCHTNNIMKSHHTAYQFNN